MVLEDELYPLDDFMHKLVADVLIYAVALALHRVFYAVFDGQQTEDEKQVVV